MRAWCKLGYSCMSIMHNVLFSFQRLSFIALFPVACCLGLVSSYVLFLTWSKPTSGAVWALHKTKLCYRYIQHMFSSSLQMYLWLVHVQKPIIPVSRGIVNETCENIPSNLTSIPPSFLLLQHKPSQENNKQMSGMGTAPSESSQVLRQAGITALVPRLEGRGQASAWLS